LQNTITKMINYLLQFREETPKWLTEYSPGDKVPFKDFMSGRVGYYPGSEFDGNLIKVCNQSHSCHAFLYVDYMVTKDRLDEHLQMPNCISGYHIVGSLDYSKSDLVQSSHPFGFDFHHEINEIIYSSTVEDIKSNAYCKMIIFERDTDKDDSWGAKRFALTYLYADGIATYYQIFCCEYGKAPWIFLLQDHGFGGNYDRFGKNGLLHKIMAKTRCYPEYTICATNTHIWDCYRPVNAPMTSGGMHHENRSLYRFDNNSHLAK